MEDHSLDLMFSFQDDLNALYMVDFSKSLIEFVTSFKCLGPIDFSRTVKIAHNKFALIIVDKLKPNEIKVLELLIVGGKEVSLESQHVLKT